VAAAAAHASSAAAGRDGATATMAAVASAAVRTATATRLRIASRIARSRADAALAVRCSARRQPKLLETVRASEIVEIVAPSHTSLRCLYLASTSSSSSAASVNIAHHLALYKVVACPVA
jgi:hypothetical protein